MIAKPVEPVFQQGLSCGFTFAGVKCNLDVRQGNPELKAQMWNDDVLCVVCGKVLSYGKHNRVVIKCTKRVWEMNEFQQFATSLWSMPSL